MKTEELHEIVTKHRNERGGLISILEAVQARYGYLPPDALRFVSEDAGLSLVDVYAVATFYRSFSMVPRGKHLCSVCLGTACHVRGGALVAKELEEHLGVVPGSTTADKEFTLEAVNCLGACALGPVVVMDGHYFSGVSPSAVGSVVEKTRRGLDEAETKINGRSFVLTVSCPRCNHSLMDPAHPIEDSPSIRVTASSGRGHGWLRLSAIYGSYRVESEHVIPPDAVVDFFCPHCHAALNSAAACAVCGAPMVCMIVRAGGVVQVCSRRGCKGHMLDLA